MLHDSAEIWNPYTPQTFEDIYSMSFNYITINFQIPTLLISMPDICCCLFCSQGNLDSVTWLSHPLCSLRLCSLLRRALWAKKLNLDFQKSLVQTNYHLPHPYSPSLLPVMCYPAPHHFWALPQPELKHKCEENYPDRKNEVFCWSFFFSSCGQYCSWPWNPIPTLQLTIWWAYFCSVTQWKPLGFFFSGWDFYCLSDLNQLLKSQRRKRRGERKRECGGK